MKRISIYAAITSLLLAIVLPAPAATEAATPEEKGLNIAREADRRNSGFVNYRVDLEMILKSRDGKKSIRELRIKTLEINNDGDKTLIVFDTPGDIKGTSFLSFAHKTGDDEQWLYLPALKRVKRIASSNKSSPFMGSEFSYEDMAGQEVEKFTYKWLRDEILNEKNSHVIEQYPADKENSGYSRQVVWMDKDGYRVLKIEYYDKRGDLLKTLMLSGHRLYNGKFWKPLTLNMVNRQTGKSTVLEFKDYRFGVDLDEQDFTKNSLLRVR